MALTCAAASCPPYVHARVGCKGWSQNVGTLTLEDLRRCWEGGSFGYSEALLQKNQGSGQPFPTLGPPPPFPLKAWPKVVDTETQL